MSGLIRRNIDTLLDDPLRSVDDLFRGFFVRPVDYEGGPRISLDVREDDSAYTVHADLPGVPKEDIQVGVEGNVVTIRAEVKQQDSHREGDKVLRTERYQGEVARSFQLPAEIDESAAKARYENGVLVLTLPKKAVNVPQRIRVE